MSHEIMKTESGYAMAYREGDALPWHAPETNPQTFPVNPSAVEVRDSARLGYDVQLVPNYFADGTSIPDSFHISRKDDPHAVYGRFVAGDWQPVQNESLLQLAELIQSRYNFEILTAGALFGGSKVFIQLQSDSRFSLPGNDSLVSNLLATVSHTGMESNKFVGCNTRVVCNNTVRQAMGENGGLICHDHRVDFDHEAIATAVGLNAESFGDFSEFAQAAARRAMSDSEALEFFKLVYGGKEKIEENGTVRHSIGVRRAMAAHRGQEFVAVGQKDSREIAAMISDRLDQIARGVVVDFPTDVTTPNAPKINPGHDLESSRGTLWGAFNTVTWSADFNPIKNRGTDQNIASNLLGEGTGGRLKQKAEKVARELLAA